MAKEVGERRCRWCGRRFQQPPGPGRPREYCRASCRQRDYEARQRAHDAGLGERDLVIARDELARLQDQLWILECAVQDVERDLTEARTVADYREAIDWLLEAARPLTRRTT